MSETESDLDFASMKVSDLKRELKARGLSITGNKTELVERLQMSLMSTNETDILAEANELLEGGDDDDEITDTSIVDPEPEKKEEVVVKKKVSIKRDTPLPVVTTPEAQTAPVTAPKSTDAEKPVVTTTVTSIPKDEEPAKAADDKPKDVKTMTDAEKAAIRRDRFGAGGTTTTTSVDVEAKKVERAQRFGLPITASNGNSKIGASPAVDIDTLKKRADRFGTVTSKTMQQLEIEEKIKKRQERFGEVKNGATPPKKASIELNKALLAPKVDEATQEKLKKRAERFGAPKP